MSSEHITRSFDADLAELQTQLIEMAAHCSHELQGVIAAFTHRDDNEARLVAAADDEINRLQRHIEEMAIRTIAIRQPMASDLRMLVAAIKMANDLERVGDYAKNISLHVTTLNQLAETGLEADVTHIAELTQMMLKEVVAAFVAEDEELALEVRDRDKLVDSYYTEVFGKLLQMNADSAAAASVCTHLLFVARSLERIGDHITNIAEEVLYIIKGEYPTEERGKADETMSMIR